MQILKCKMCGGDLRIEEGKTVCECEYCGSKQTVPSVDNEKKVKLFSRANRLRIDSEFDKAYGIYESIVTEFPNEAEAYWGLILCDFGIEYVDDPKTGNKIPTCHRSSFNSVFDDENYKMVLENADVLSKKVYQEEAERIESLRKDIIKLSSKEESYDIFICYKETDSNGDRTMDSVLAQEIYNELVQKDYRVFFSRITLEDKLGQEYEPYIFAALNSAKIMLVIGTSHDNFDAIWVKNEWSRYLSLIEQGKKKVLIPCYKNMNVYEIPKELSHLQAQDMSKLGFLQDLLHGIEKIIGKNVIREENVVPYIENKIDNAKDKESKILQDKYSKKFEEVKQNLNFVKAKLFSYTMIVSTIIFCICAFLYVNNAEKVDEVRSLLVGTTWKTDSISMYNNSSYKYEINFSEEGKCSILYMIDDFVVNSEQSCTWKVKPSIFGIKIFTDYESNGKPADCKLLVDEKNNIKATFVIK